jgi:hypothetical protein
VAVPELLSPAVEQGQQPEIEPAEVWAQPLLPVLFFAQVRAQVG